MTFDPIQAIASMKHGLPAGAESRAPRDQDQFAFQRWWYNEGSGMRPAVGEDWATFVEYMTAIAWSNGAFRARHGS